MGIEVNEIVNLIGQFFGFIGVIFAFLSYQMPTQKKVLFVNMLLTVTMALNYFFIGAYSGCVLNIGCTCRNLVYSNKQIFKGKKWAFIMCGVIAVLGLLSWQGAVSLLIFAGLIINTYCLSLPNPQTLRKSILLTSGLILVYDIIVFSLGGIIIEGISIVSAIIGIIRYRS